MDCPFASAQKKPDIHLGTVLPLPVQEIVLAFSTASQGSQHSDSAHVAFAHGPVGSGALMNIPALVQEALGNALPPPLKSFAQLEDTAVHVSALKDAELSVLT